MEIKCCNALNINMAVCAVVLCFVCSTSARAFSDYYPEPNPPIIIAEDAGIDYKVYLLNDPSTMTEWTFHKTSDGTHPDGNEQQMMWLMNQARSDPEQEGIWLSDTGDFNVAQAINYFDVDVDLLKSEFAGYEIKPPAAFDNRLYEAAKVHSEDLIAREAQDHNNQFTRVSDAGFVYRSGRGNVFSYAKTALYAHAAFNIDWGYGSGGMQDGRGHRMAIMSVDGDYTNVGLATVPSNNAVGPLVVTGNYFRANTSVENHYNIFIVGTVWEDSNNNNIYDPGEGIGDVPVVPDQGSFFAITSDSGGYAIPITANGAYQVEFQLPGQSSVSIKTVTIADQSELCDYILGETLPSGDMDLDGDVDGVDVDLFVDAFENSSPEADINQSGGVDSEDLYMFANYFGSP